MDQGYNGNVSVASIKRLETKNGKVYLWTHEDLHVVGWLDQLVLSTFELGVVMDWL